MSDCDQGRLLTSQRTNRERASWFLRVRALSSVVSQLILHLQSYFSLLVAYSTWILQPRWQRIVILSVTLCPSLDPSINNGTTIHAIAPQYAKFQCLWRRDWQEQCNIVRDSVRCTVASSLASAKIFPDLRMRSLFCVVLKMRPRAKC